MPSRSRAQQRFFGRELRKVEEGGKSSTGMSEQQLREFAATKHKGIPLHVKKPKK